MNQHLTSLGGVLQRLRDNSRGVTVIEYALISPVFLTLLMGGMDVAQEAYALSLLNGATQKIARADTIQNANTSTNNATVLQTLAPVLPNVTVNSVRQNYNDFADIGRSEKWNDTNNNGLCDNGETYVDENSDGHFSTDVAESGNGGANDVVVWTVTATYRPMFYAPFVSRIAGTRTLKSVAIKKNQPFAAQTPYNNATGICA